MRRERLLLEDIVSAADQVAEFAASQTQETFELRDRHPNIPWADIKGFRNIVVHNYFGIDWPEVWRAATKDAPLLRDEVAEILRLEFPD